MFYLCKHDLQTRWAHRRQDVSCLVYSLCLSLFGETNVSCHDGTRCCHCWSLILSASCNDANIHLLEIGLWSCLKFSILNSKYSRHCKEAVLSIRVPGWVCFYNMSIFKKDKKTTRCCYRYFDAVNWNLDSVVCSVKLYKWCTFQMLKACCSNLRPMTPYCALNLCFFTGTAFRECTGFKKCWNILMDD